MLAKEMTVRSESGIHVRAAAGIVRIANAHSSKVSVSRASWSTVANAASILELLTLNAKKGSVVKIDVDGPDEVVVMRKLTEYFENGGGI